MTVHTKYKIGERVSYYDRAVRLTYTGTVTQIQVTIKPTGDTGYTETIIYSIDTGSKVALQLEQNIRPYTVTKQVKQL